MQSANYTNYKIGHLENLWKQLFNEMMNNKDQNRLNCFELWPINEKSDIDQKKVRNLVNENHLFIW